MAGSGHALLRYDAARTALAAAHHIDEVRDLRDKAQALSSYARQAQDTDLIAWATEIKVRAERRCGELLREQAKTGQRSLRGRPKKETSHDGRFLKDLGISYNQSSRYQALASMPNEHFEAAIATVKSAVGEVTSAHMLRLAAEMKRTGDVRANIAKHDQDTRWQVFRHRLVNAGDAIADLRMQNTPKCAPEEAGRILLAWRDITNFLRKELGYDNQNQD